MRLIRVAIPVSFLFFATACGGSSTTTTTPPAAAPTSASPSASASGGPSSSASGGPSSSAGGLALTGTLGLPGNPEAFEIFLKDAAGTDVTTLKAGTYQIKITDQSKQHNFHLKGKGPGSADFTTGPISETPGEVTWPVTLVAGDYEYKCDPHPNMVKTFTVT